MAAPNYIKVINSFWDEAPYLDGFKTDHPALFHAIVDAINRNDWRDTEIEYDRIIYKVRMGKVNYLAARTWLQDNKFITLIEGRGKYVKAKFGLGEAVLPRTGKKSVPAQNEVPVRTGTDIEQDVDAVLGRTGSDTGTHTSTDALPVQNRTGTDTGTHTGSDTGTHTHLIINNKPLNLETLKQQHQQDADDDVVDEKIEDEFLEEGTQKKETPPLPLPTADDVRAELMTSAPHKRYAFERLKLVKTDEEYADLVELYITQQEMQAKPNRPVFHNDLGDVRRHFMNWLGKRPEINASSNKSNGSKNGTYSRTTSSLRPTAIGVPDYRGEGSHCDVDL